MARKTRPTSRTHAVRQGEDDYKVGPGHPPVEHQFQPGQSGNPDGPPKRRTNLWLWFCKYLELTDAEIAALDQKSLTQVQQTALNLIAQLKAGEKVGSTRMARYVVDRDEGRAVEHIILTDEDSLSDGECEELRTLIRQRHGTE